MNNKKILILFYITCSLFLKSNVSALIKVPIDSTSGFYFDNEDIDIKICDVGTHDSYIAADNSWSFKIYTIKKLGPYRVPFPGASEIIYDKKEMSTYYWNFSHSVTKLCPAGGCSDDIASISASGVSASEANFSSLFNSDKYKNIYADDIDANNNIFSDKELASSLLSGKCPNYIYSATSAKKGQMAFIFSDVLINNSKEIFETNGYTVSFIANDPGSSLEEEYKKEFELHLEKMQNKIDEFNNLNYGTKYNQDCFSYSRFGGIMVDSYDSSDPTASVSNMVVRDYYKHKNNLRVSDPDYDFTNAEKIVAEYKSLKCATINTIPPTDKNNNDNNDSNVSNCEVLPEAIKKYLMDALKLIRWIGLVLLVILGTLDFVKASAADDQDAMKKASQNFIKRLIAVIILFLLPILIEFILYVAGLAGLGCGDITEF